jgi:hypothetical protein
MIHRVRSPDSRIVTHGTVVGERLTYMILTCRLLELRHMTLVAVGVRQLVVAVHMTSLARLRDVCTRERKLGSAVIERRRLPCGRVMTLGTVMIETAGTMAWICCTCIIARMTTVAIRGQILILIVDVTLNTCHRLMRASQCEWRTAMIECGWLPCRCRVTRLAILAEVPHHMVRIH